MHYSAEQYTAVHYNTIGKHKSQGPGNEGAKATSLRRRDRGVASGGKKPSALERRTTMKSMQHDEVARATPSSAGNKSRVTRTSRRGKSTDLVGARQRWYNSCRKGTLFPAHKPLNLLRPPLHQQPVCRLPGDGEQKTGDDEALKLERVSVSIWMWSIWMWAPQPPTS